MRLLGGTVLLEPLKPAAKSDGGIFYDMSRRDDRKQWRVLAVGPGRRLKNGTREAPEVRVGDKCLFNAGIGMRLKLEDGRVIADSDNIEMIWT